ncbi:phenylacetate--CoA ligase family protein [Streptomyces sp. S6]
MTATAFPYTAVAPGVPENPVQLANWLIPDGEWKPDSVDAVEKLPSFLSKMRECARVLGTPYSQIPHEVQDALVLRRLQQMVHTVLLNPLWRSTLRGAGITGAPRSLDEWQSIPLADKNAQRDFFMDDREGMVVPLDRGGFEIVASGGTSSGRPLETVYSLRELWDTYQVAGHFMGAYQLAPRLTGAGPKWLYTTLADYQMWSSGTMVGGVLQNVPGVNYIGAGPVTAPVLEHMFSYPGPKALMGITAGIAILSELGAGMNQAARESFRLALYGSGVLPQRGRADLRAVYPNVEILSYFAATQAETIGLQLDPGAPELSAVPGLHLVEIVDEQGRWVPEGAEGELVVTRLHAHEAPLLRLKLGDRMIRRSRLNGPGLKADRFEFAGRTGDVLHLNDSQYSATAALAGLGEELRAAGVVDLDTAAHDLQFVNHREAKLLTLLVSVDNPQDATYRTDAMLGPYGTRRVFLKVLPRALSLFNHGEANPASIEKTGYGFRVQFVSKGSPEVERTDVGKVPLVRDRGQ